MMTSAILALVLNGVLQDRPATVIPVEDLAPTQAGSYDWLARHQAVVDRVKKGTVDVILVGDSITHGWGGDPQPGGPGQELWSKYFGGRNAVNMGFGWDKTQHVLWRFEHGALDGIHPKVAVVMIGTNNIGSDSTADIAAGVTAIVDTLKARTPKTKVLLLAIFPRDQEATGPNRRLVSDVNAKIAPLGKRRGVTYLDLTSIFLEPNGTIAKETMWDALHPTPSGYAKWASAMEPTLAKLLGERPRPL
jgi:lysophospholipase L1-like esterase